MGTSFQEQKPHLPIHEWLAVAFLVGLLLSLTILSLFFTEHTIPDQQGTLHHVVDQDIEVFVEGAVEKPGSYIVKRGTLVKDVVALAVPNGDANLQPLKLNNKLRKGQTVKVAKQKPPKKPRRKRKKTTIS